jgi:hypothetical protein
MKGILIVILAGLLAGCEERTERMAHPEDPAGRYQAQIAAAHHLLAQNEDWSDRAEWEVIQTKDGWDVVAWRVEHPEAEGAERYSPAGYSVIQLDARMTPVHYLPRK